MNALCFAGVVVRHLTYEHRFIAMQGETHCKNDFPGRCSCSGDTIQIELRNVATLWDGSRTTDLRGEFLSLRLGNDAFLEHPVFLSDLLQPVRNADFLYSRFQA